MQPVLVPGPAVSPLRIGLIAGGRTPPPDELGRWQLGIWYDPDFDDLGGQFPSDACDPPDPLEPGDLEKIIPDGQALNEWWPWSLWVGEECSTMGGVGRDFFEPKLRRQLIAQSSRLLEQTFSTGVITISATEAYTFDELGYPNRALQDAAATTPNGSDAVPVVTALADMVGALADEIGSARGMIHVPHTLLPFLDFYGQTLRNPGDGSFITLKSHDHLVIAGTGYSGAAPDGAMDAGVAWIYGTSLVEVRVEPADQIDVYPPVGMDDTGVDTRQNRVEYRAERLGLASWDLSAHIAIAVDLTDPGPAIAGS